MNPESLKTDCGRLSDLLSYNFSADTRQLREEALRFHTGRPWLCPPTRDYIDAKAWKSHADDEDWLMWRARQTADRLSEMPISTAEAHDITGWKTPSWVLRTWLTAFSS